MYAVIKTGGKQYRVQPGDGLLVEKLDGDFGAEVAFDQVLMVGGGEGEGAHGCLHRLRGPSLGMARRRAPGLRSPHRAGRGRVTP